MERRGPWSPYEASWVDRGEMRHAGSTPALAIFLPRNQRRGNSAPRQPQTRGGLRRARRGGLLGPLERAEEGGAGAGALHQEGYVAAAQDEPGAHGDVLLHGRV